MILILDLVASNRLGFGPGQSTTRLSQALIVTLGGAAVAGAAIAATSNQAAPLSPAVLLLLIPVFRAGEGRGRLAAVAAVAISMSLVFGTALVRGTLTAPYVRGCLQSAILALALGLLGAWTAKLKERRTQERSTEAPAAHAACLLYTSDAADDLPCV